MCPPRRLPKKTQILGKLLSRTSNPEARNVSKPSPLPVSEYLFEDPPSFVEVPRLEKVRLSKTVNHTLRSQMTLTYS